MFPFAAADHLSHRNRKDLARAAQLREIARAANRQSFPSAPAAAAAGATDDLYLPPLNHNLWRRNTLGAARTPSFPAPYPPDHYAPPRLDSLLNERFPPLHRTSSLNAYPRPSYRDTHASSAASFTKAARALHDALDKGTRYIANLEHEFQQDTGFAAVYASPRVIACLWTAKMEWSGVPVREALENPDASPSPEVQYFAKHAARLVEAIEVMRSVEFPCRGLRDEGGELSAEDVKTTLRKLGVSMGAIVGNLEALRGDRTRLAALVRELKSAMGLLCDVGELWMVKRNGGKEGARFASGGDEVWPGGN